MPNKIDSKQNIKISNKDKKTGFMHSAIVMKTA